MGQLSFKTTYRVNSNLVVSPAELIERYFFGTYPRTTDGENMSEETILHYLRAAQEEVEKYLSLKFKKQVVQEHLDYIGSDYRDWGYLKTTYPVVHAERLTGSLNNLQQISYPKEWLSVTRPVNGIPSRNVALVPAHGHASVEGIVFTGSMLSVGLLSTGKIPNYWTLQYVTGFDRMPDAIVKVICQLAAIPIFMILGDLILGAGIASQSISIDGLSQSISSTSSATNSGYGSRIIEIRKDLEANLPALKDAYVGFRFLSC